MERIVKEALRYLGFRGRPADEETVRMAEEILQELQHTLTPKCVYKRYAVEVTERTVVLDGWRIESEKLAHHLRGCKAAYLFAATLGVQADRKIRQLSARSMTRGAVANAVCSARIEDYCDAMQAQLAEAQQKLESRALTLAQTGSIAEAALALNNVFDAAETAAQQYLENVRLQNGDQEAVCRRMEAEAQAKAGQIIADAEQYAQEVYRRADAYWEDIYNRAQQLTAGAQQGDTP